MLAECKEQCSPTLAFVCVLHEGAHRLLKEGDTFVEGRVKVCTTQSDLGQLKGSPSKVIPLLST